MLSKILCLLTSLIGLIAVLISGAYDSALSASIGGGFLLGVVVTAFMGLFDD